MVCDVIELSCTYPEGHDRNSLREPKVGAIGNASRGLPHTNYDDLGGPKVVLSLREPHPLVRKRNIECYVGKGPQICGSFSLRVGPVLLMERQVFDFLARAFL